MQKSSSDEIGKSLAVFFLRVLYAIGIMIPTALILVSAWALYAGEGPRKMILAIPLLLGVALLCFEYFQFRKRISFWFFCLRLSYIKWRRREVISGA